MDKFGEWFDGYIGFVKRVKNNYSKIPGVSKKYQNILEVLGHVKARYNKSLKWTPANEPPNTDRDVEMKIESKSVAGFTVILIGKYSNGKYFSRDGLWLHKAIDLSICNIIAWRDLGPIGDEIQPHPKTEKLISGKPGDVGELGRGLK